MIQEYFVTSGGALFAVVSGSPYEINLDHDYAPGRYDLQMNRIGDLTESSVPERQDEEDDDDLD